MNLEKRSAGAKDATPAQTPAGEKKNKPVIVYIMVLFIVAFLLMALSFLMHLRSNQEVIGTLQSSVYTLQELQDSQDANIDLQSKLSAANKQIDDLQSQLSDQDSTDVTSNAKVDALLSLYTLQQQYSAEDYDACKQTIQSMETAGESDLLPIESSGDVVSPAQRYQQLKEAVMSN